MKSMRRRFAAAVATLAFAALAAPAAHAEEVVPPGNSAVIQYTETIPSAGGQKDAEGKKGTAKPGDVLGSSTTHKLESKGETGKEVAEFAAETAPPSGSTSQGASPEKNDGGKKHKSDGGSAPPASTGGNGGGGDGGAGLGPAEGSSAVGQIAGQATGTSSGELGLLLPLILLAAAGWAGTYYWRKRHRIA